MPGPRRGIRDHANRPASVALAPATRCSLTLLPLLLLAVFACGERGPGNVRTVSPGTPEALIDVCAPCSKACVNGYIKQCILGKVHSEKTRSGGCLVYCVGEREKYGKSEWW